MKDAKTQITAGIRLSNNCAISRIIDSTVYIKELQSYIDLLGSDWFKDLIGENERRGLLVAMKGFAKESEPIRKMLEEEFGK